jgi:hypothetical protein
MRTLFKRFLQWKAIKALFRTNRRRRARGRRRR